jgi:hypothetical protein
MYRFLAPARRSLSYRPRIEALERRELPSTVTTLADSGPGSLRDALAVTPAFGRVDFQPGLAGTIALTSGSLTIDKSLTLAGPGPKVLTVSGSGVYGFGIFYVPKAVTVTLAGLTLTGGYAYNLGGAIDNAGTLTVTDCLIRGNAAGGGLSAGSGGGIYNSGTLTVDGSTVADNKAGSQQGVGGDGGGIDNEGTATVVNSTVYANRAGDDGGSFGIGGVGGGIFSSGTLTLVNSTVAGNSVSASAPVGGGGGVNGSALLVNTVVAMNTGKKGPDFYGMAVAGSHHNLVGNGADSGGLVDGENGNQVGTPSRPINPKLGPLADNGGPTPTLALLPGSPAIAAGGNGALVPNLDQRGYFRDAAVKDVGAFAAGVVTGPFFAVGGVPGRLQVRRDLGGSSLQDFAPFGSYAGGVSVAVGDVDGDGYPELVAAAHDGNPHVKVYRGKAIATGTFDPANPDGSLLTQFFAYGLNFGVGANVAVADLNRDGYADVVTGAAPGNPHVKVFDGKAIALGTFDPGDPDASALASFFAYGLNFNVGANVAAGTAAVPGPGGSSDAIPVLVTGPTAGNPHVKVYHFIGGGLALFTEFFAYGLGFDVGANVAIAQAGPPPSGSTEPVAEGLVTGATTGNPHVKVYGLTALAAVPGQPAFDPADPDASLRTQFFADAQGAGTGVSVGSADFEELGQFGVLTGTDAGTPRYRAFRGDASGLNPPALFEGVAAGILGEPLVGA